MPVSLEQVTSAVTRIAPPTVPAVAPIVAAEIALSAGLGVIVVRELKKGFEELGHNPFADVARSLGTIFRHPGPAAAPSGPGSDVTVGGGPDATGAAPVQMPPMWQADP